MNCHDFDRVWNERLDARADRAADLMLAEALLAARDHARDCAACRRAQLGYEALHRGLMAWGSAPEASACPPPELAERVLAALAKPAGSIPARPRRSRWPGLGLSLGLP